LIKNAFLTFPHLYFYRSDNVYYGKICLQFLNNG
jgi:hypothetical protein